MRRKHGSSRPRRLPRPHLSWASSEVSAPDIPVVVTRHRKVADDIVHIVLESPDGTSLPAFAAGAHIDVELPNGLVRQYSLLGDPAYSRQYELGVLREPAGRGGSRSAHDDLRVGTQIRIGAPRSLFALVPARRSLLFAGGIGITPMLAMAQQLARSRADFTLHYCSRTPARTAFLDRLGDAPWADRVRSHFDDGDAQQKLDAAAVLAAPSADTHLYVCGPPGFMGYVIGAARAAGWPDACIHSESFSARPARSGDEAFEVRLARSGRVVSVATDRTVAAALATHGVEIPLSCEQGICGTCVTRVLEGEPDHRDMFFSDAEKAANDRFTPCCSRAKSAVLVLDL
jgi:vanillate monooxygenase ferredoxin subunit